MMGVSDAGVVTDTIYGGFLALLQSYFSTCAHPTSCGCLKAANASQWISPANSLP